jgi:predicted nuclease with RNAse H fold
MGISVFWCLPPTMKSLTMRGRRFAEEFRKHGLHPAGINGEYLTGSPTHDEADAITSALVGLFYVAGDYLALGTPTEDYLIVPRSPKIKYGSSRRS